MWGREEYVCVWRGGDVIYTAMRSLALFPFLFPTLFQLSPVFPSFFLPSPYPLPRPLLPPCRSVFSPPLSILLFLLSPFPSPSFLFFYFFFLHPSSIFCCFFSFLISFCLQFVTPCLPRSCSHLPRLGSSLALSRSRRYMSLTLTSFGVLSALGARSRSFSRTGACQVSRSPGLTFLFYQGGEGVGTFRRMTLRSYFARSSRSW